MAVGRIILQSTSRMSLNDRFTGLRGDSTDGSIQQRRQTIAASRKNQRLAQQMEHRPAVIAALRNTDRRGGRGVVRGGLLRGARGARGGVMKVGGTVRGGGAGAIATAATTVTTIASPRGRGNPYRARGASVRGISFRTGNARVTGVATQGSAVPVKKRLAVQGRLSQPTPTRGRGFNRGRGMVTRGGNNLRGRLSTGGRGGGGGANVRGSFQTRTFRPRGRGGMRGAGRGRGRGGAAAGYSQHWQNGQ